MGSGLCGAAATSSGTVPGSVISARVVVVGKASTQNTNFLEQDKLDNSLKGKHLQINSRILKLAKGNKDLRDALDVAVKNYDEADAGDILSPKGQPSSPQGQLRRQSSVPVQKRPRCVISYKTENKEFLKSAMTWVEELGFEGWNGSMVVASQDWKSQWIEKVDDEETRLVIFLLSEIFWESPSCQDEFSWVMDNARLRSMALPILIENFKMAPRMSFSLQNVNYVHPNPQWTEPATTATLQSMEIRELKSKYPRMPLWDVHSSAPQLDLLDAEKVRAVTDGKAEELRAEASLCDTTATMRTVGVIGSVNFNYSTDRDKSKTICEMLGKKLANLVLESDEKQYKVALVTGGCSGVGAVTARAFHQARVENGIAADKTATFLILPETDDQLSRLAGQTMPLEIDGKVVWVPEADGSKEAYWTNRSTESKGEQRIGAWPDEFGKTWQFGQSDKIRKRFLGEALPTIIFIEGGPGARFEATAAFARGHTVLPIGALGGSAKDFAEANKKKLQKAFDKHEAFAAIQDSKIANDVEDLTDKVVELLKITMVKDAVDHGLDAVQSQESCTKCGLDLYKVWSSLPQEAQGVVTVLKPDSAEGLAQYIDQNGGHVVLIDGFGTRNLYKDMTLDDFKTQLEPVVKRLDKMLKEHEKDGKRSWVAMYGGDPIKKDAVDAAWIVQALHEGFGIKIIATQVDMYGEYIMDQPSLTENKIVLSNEYTTLKGGAVMLYKTCRMPNTAGQMEVVYGGLDKDNKPVGASHFWFSTEVEKRVVAHIVMGGGRISCENVSYCLFQAQKTVFYIACAAQNEPEDREKSDKPYYGEVHEFMKTPRVQKCATQHCWNKTVRSAAKGAERIPYIELTYSE